MNLSLGYPHADTWDEEVVTYYRDKLHYVSGDKLVIALRNRDSHTKNELSLLLRAILTSPYPREWLVCEEAINVTSTEGLLFYLSLHGCSNAFLVKVPRETTSSLLHEARVGHVLNKLNIPNFMYTHGYFEGSFFSKDFQVVTWDPNRGNVVCNIVENIGNAVPFSTAIKTMECGTLASVLLNIFNALHQANEACGFIHYDLHGSNVLIREETEPIFTTLYSGHILEAKVMPYIIDYGYARIIDGSVHVGAPRTTSLTCSTDNFPLHDVYRLLCSLASIIQRGDNITKGAQRCFALLDDLFQYFEEGSLRSRVDRWCRGDFFQASQAHIGSTMLEYLYWAEDILLVKTCSSCHVNSKPSGRLDIFSSRVPLTLVKCVATGSSIRGNPNLNPVAAINKIKIQHTNLCKMILRVGELHPLAHYSTHVIVTERFIDERENLLNDVLILKDVLGSLNLQVSIAKQYHDLFFVLAFGEIQVSLQQGSECYDRARRIMVSDMETIEQYRRLVSQEEDTTRFYCRSYTTYYNAL